MRESPEFSGKVLATIPFGSKVKVFPNAADSNFVYDNHLFDSDSISGNWVKVVFLGKTGFVFDAYLGYGIRKMDKSMKLIMEDAAGCWSDAYASKAYYYYGVFLGKDRKTASIKIIRPVFHTTREEVTGTSMHASGKERPFFILVTKEPLAEEGPVKRFSFTTKIAFEDPKEGNFGLIRYGNLLPPVRIPEGNWEITGLNQKKTGGDPVYDENVIQLKDFKSGQIQVILDASYGIHNARVVWCGDLDRDGIQDLMIMCDNGQEGFCALFLSRNAPKGKLMLLADIYYWGACW
jgi:hypothetical protein